MKDGSGAAWLAKNVVPYGLVKSTGDDSTMILTKLITNAEAEAKGTPKPFNPTEMMKRRPN